MAMGILRADGRQAAARRDYHRVAALSCPACRMVKRREYKRLLRRTTMRLSEGAMDERAALFGLLAAPADSAVDCYHRACARVLKTATF